MIKDELEVLNHEGKIVFTKFDNTEKDYGIFVYSRKAENDSKPPIDMTYCGDEEDAKLMFYKRAYDFDKKEWWVELWKADEEGTYGVSGEPILTSYTDKV